MDFIESLIASGFQMQLRLSSASTALYKRETRIETDCMRHELVSDLFRSLENFDGVINIFLRNFFKLKKVLVEYFGVDRATCRSNYRQSCPFITKNAFESR